MQTSIITASYGPSGRLNQRDVFAYDNKDWIASLPPVTSFQPSYSVKIYSQSVSANIVISSASTTQTYIQKLGPVPDAIPGTVFVPTVSLSISGTQLPSVTASQFASRLVNLFPQSWVGDVAKTVGGVLYSLMYAIGNQLSYEEINELLYAKNTTRLATATDTALNTWSQDLFGLNLLRVSGETDTAFRQRIHNNLLMPTVTRVNIQKDIAQNVGIYPRMAEPWSIYDTCAWDIRGYWDVDSATMPFKWGDPGLRYAGFIDTTIQLYYGATGGNPLYGLDIGMAWDISQSAWRSSDSPYILVGTPVYNVINSTRAFGTTIWVKITPTVIFAQPVKYAMGTESDFDFLA